MQLRNGKIINCNTYSNDLSDFMKKITGNYELDKEIFTTDLREIIYLQKKSTLIIDQVNLFKSALQMVREFKTLYYKNILDSQDEKDKDFIKLFHTYELKKMDVINNIVPKQLENQYINQLTVSRSLKEIKDTIETIHKLEEEAKILI